MAVHVAEASAYYTNEQQHELLIVSVIADEAVPSAAVLAAAHDVAGQAAQRVPVHRSLFDLPLMDAPLWTVWEEPVLTSAIGGREEVGTAVLEAAAVTAVAAPTGFVQPEQGLRRIAELRFRHPYAVVAVATQSDRVGNGVWTPGPWHGLPVFSTWVTEPDETAA